MECGDPVIITTADRLSLNYLSRKPTVQNKISFHEVIRLEPELYSDGKREGVISMVMLLRYDVLRVS